MLALFNIESMMTSRAKTPQAELQQAQAIREYTENINRILGEVERARDVETDAIAAMNKAKSKLQGTSKEKLGERDGQQNLDLLCEAVDKMSNASAEYTTLEQ